MKTPTIKTIERQFPNQWVLIGYRDERWGTLEGRCAQGWQETARSRRGNRQEQRQETVFFLQRNSCIAKYGFRTVVRTLSEILERNQLQPLPSCPRKRATREFNVGACLKLALPGFHSRARK